MAQSSGSSDSGNDSFVDGTAEQDDVEEWAQNILEESYVEYVAPEPRRNHRSSSITSDDGSNDSAGSPKGFWRVRPGSSPDCLSDEGSVNWSPVMSSHTAIELGEEDPPLDLSCAPVSRRRSVQFADEVQNVQHHTTPPSGSSFMLPPAVIEAPSHGTTKIEFSRQESNDSNGMRRSKSYSAFGRSGSIDEDQSKIPKSANAANKTAPFDDRENIRTYFLKFSKCGLCDKAFG